MRLNSSLPLMVTESWPPKRAMESRAMQEVRNKSMTLMTSSRWRSNPAWKVAEAEEEM